MCKRWIEIEIIRGEDAITGLVVPGGNLYWYIKRSQRHQN
jgi:hypothetical protein